MGNFKSIIVSEKPDRKDYISYDFIYMKSQKGKIIQTQNKSEVAKDGERETDLALKRHKGIGGSDETVLNHGCGGGH